MPSGFHGNQTCQENKVWAFVHARSSHKWPRILLKFNAPNDYTNAVKDYTPSNLRRPRTIVRTLGLISCMRIVFLQEHGCTSFQARPDPRRREQPESMRNGSLCEQNDVITTTRRRANRHKNRGGLLRTRRCRHIDTAPMTTRSTVVAPTRTTRSAAARPTKISPAKMATRSIVAQKSARGQTGPLSYKTSAKIGASIPDVRHGNVPRNGENAAKQKRRHVQVYNRGHMDSDSHKISLNILGP